MYPHLIRAIKFEMTLVDSTSQNYHLSPELHESIYNAMLYEATWKSATNFVYEIHLMCAIKHMFCYVCYMLRNWMKNMSAI